jgi:Uma2 family endonuclease
MATEVREVVEARDKPPCLTRRAASIEEFWSLPESTLSVEYINGEIVMAPAPTTNHQTAVGNIYFALRTHVEHSKDGVCYLSPLDVVLPTGEVVQPDVLFLTNEKAKRSVTDKRIHGAPSLVVEILSPGSTTLDTLTKRELYEQSGVREYWIVDPEARTVAQLVLRKKRYAVTQLDGDDVLASVVLKGFEMRVGELFGL